MARTRGQSDWLVGIVFPVDAFFMFLRLSHRDHVVRFAASGVDHEHHYSLPHTQRLQAQFAVGITRILSGNGKPSEHRFAANKVEAMLFNVGLAWRLTSSYVTIHKL